ncbi:MAG: hypothetical protein Q9218_008187, partial [Villophora microphyllina]
PSGDLIITLDNDFSTTIPNNALFTPKRGSDQFGHYVITNSSLIEAGVAYNLQGDPSGIQPLLGGVWLTQNYLLVDYRKGQFSLGKAVQGPGVPQDIEAICSSAITRENQDDHHSGKGKIAGGVVGGLAAIAASGLIIVLMIKKCRRHRACQKGDASNSATYPNMIDDPYTDHTTPNELPL